MLLVILQNLDLVLCDQIHESAPEKFSFCNVAAFFSKNVSSYFFQDYIMKTGVIKESHAIFFTFSIIQLVNSTELIGILIPKIIATPQSDTGGNIQ